MPEPGELTPIGRVESTLTDPASAPKQGFEGAPEAWLAFDDSVARRAHFCTSVGRPSAIFSP